MKSYYQKESPKEKAEKVMDEWLHQVYETNIPKLTTFANTFKTHRQG
jgi:hypothetical protein